MFSKFLERGTREPACGYDGYVDSSRLRFASPTCPHTHIPTSPTGTFFSNFLFRNGERKTVDTSKSSGFRADFSCFFYNKKSASVGYSVQCRVSVSVVSLRFRAMSFQPLERLSSCAPFPTHDMLPLASLTSARRDFPPHPTLNHTTQLRRVG